MTALLENLEYLYKRGQSIWYDNLSRDVLQSGALANIIKQGVTGLTSNPTIFKKAIADSADYDAEINELAAKGLTAEEITEALCIEDVGKAADLLKPIYVVTEGRDGYASIEVSPNLAYDTEGTITAGERIWKTLNRPNIMIKVPATKEGIPAVKALLSKGINVNITLIFSVQRYAEVIKAYQDASQKPASVASFFVSRVDSIVEKALKDKPNILAKYQGKVAIANSIEAYELFEKSFKGAKNFQRPLWASTSVKNPALSALLYVDSLVAKQTVNTVPPQTLEEIAKGVSRDKDLDTYREEAKKTLKALAKDGVNLPALLNTLEKEGVASFKQSYSELVAAVQTKKGSLVSNATA